ncbi:MAG: hypothetical protein AAFY49_12300, partial [Pseudomonadota bacterium]
MRTVKLFAIVAVICLLVALGAFLAFAPGYVERARNAITPGGPFLVSDDAQALHDTLVVGDWHADSLLWQRDIGKRGARPCRRAPPDRGRRGASGLYRSDKIACGPELRGQFGGCFRQHH